MSEQLRLPLPIWQLQYHLVGGHRRMIITLVCAVSVLAIGILGTYRLVGQPFAVIGGYILWFHTGIQAFIMILSGCNAVYRAMLRDHQSKMIESHRLTPMSNMTIVTGYLIGPNLQTLLLFCVFTVSGAIVSRASGLPVDAWVYGNLMLLIGAVMVWSASVFLGMRQEKPINPAPIVVGLSVLSFPIGMVPALGLFTGFYACYLSLWLMAAAPKIPTQATIMIIGVCLAYTLFWISTAAVKYRRPDLPALTGARGLFLLGMSLLFGTGGIIAFERIATSSPSLQEFYKSSLVRTQWLVTMNGALLLAAIVTSGAVRCRVLGSRGTALRGRSDRMSPLTIAILSAVLVCAIMAGVGSSIWWTLLPRIESDRSLDNVAHYALIWAWTLTACLLATLTLRTVLETAFRSLSSPKVLVIVFLIVTWGVPPLIDSIHMTYLREVRGIGVDYGWLTAACPPGMLAAIWGPLDIRLWPGLVTQIGVLLILILVARRARRNELVKSEE